MQEQKAEKNGKNCRFVYITRKECSDRDNDKESFSAMKSGGYDYVVIKKCYLEKLQNRKFKVGKQNPTTQSTTETKLES